jgi:hypothetical protein
MIRLFNHYLSVRTLLLTLIEATVLFQSVLLGFQLRLSSSSSHLPVTEAAIFTAVMLLTMTASRPVPGADRAVPLHGPAHRRRLRPGADADEPGVLPGADHLRRSGRVRHHLGPSHWAVSCWCA